MDDNSLSSTSSNVLLDGYVAADNLKQAPSPEEEDIRKWLESLFMQSVKVGERLLEDGHLAMAAIMFANATLLTDQIEVFVEAVQRVYPSYFYRLYELRLHTMGYDHLFPKNKIKMTGHGSPVNDNRFLFDNNSRSNSSNSQHTVAVVSLMPQ